MRQTGQAPESYVATEADVLVIGSGMAGLTTASLLARDGLRVIVLEQNWLPGGCSSSYPRKGVVFESGATTLVGLDPHMPLRHLLDEIQLDLNPWKLNTPMQVHLHGETLTRHQELDAWIEEAERVFGPKSQRPFWEYCFKISQMVWKTSLQQRAFPPSNLRDLLNAARHFRPAQLSFASLAFRSMKQLLKQHGLLGHEAFEAFVNEQLLITAQNHLEEVNVLFGATALCYTNFDNYYMPGGLIQLVQPLVQYIEDKGGQVLLQQPVVAVARKDDHYSVQARFRKKTTVFQAAKVVSALPINNTLDLWPAGQWDQKYRPKLMNSRQVNSAFSLGFVAHRRHSPSCLHHQVHLEKALPYTGSKSIFLSWSHPDDPDRCGPDELVGSVSTHVPDPDQTWIEHKEEVVVAIFQALEEAGILQKEDVKWHHASTPKAWEKWTGRRWGFVGGYPQYMHIKPWQMIDARLDHKGAYICGDSTYPGQGIPGACLSGIIAYEKMKLDGLP